MYRIRKLAQYYLDAMVKLGMFRFSLLLAFVLIILTTMLMMLVTLFMSAHIEYADIVRAFLFSLLITPCAVFFLSIIIDELEHSRRWLSQTVITLEKEIQHGEQTRQELEKQSSLLNSFFDASPDLVFYRDENFSFSGCNRAMELLCGKREKQLIGLKPEQVYEEEIAKKVIETDEQVFQHHISVTYEIWIKYPDGRKACFEVRKVPFYDKVGNRKGLIGFGRDITEHKRYQQTLEQVSRDKTAFITTISHELRTPLNAIVGLSRILLDTKLTTEQSQYLKTIYVSAVTLGNIFNDIVEMDRIERHKTQLYIQSINCSDFLINLENIVGLLVKTKNLYFKLECQEPLPEYILADRTRLQQILWNLVENAIKYTQQGEVTIRVYYVQEQDQLCFHVEDTGVGISAEEQQQIFTMYYQVEHKEQIALGSGIGLAVSQKLAQEMGGSITVKSEIGKGSCFKLTIHAPQTKGTVTDDNDIMPVLHILLVEDIELNVTVARSVLEKLGHSLDVAMTGQEALDIFAPGEYDLILLDIQLPDISGLEVAKSLHQRYAPDELPPIIALTANVLKEKKEYLDAGMADVLIKPLSVSALITMIKQFWPAPNEETEQQNEKSKSNQTDSMREQRIDTDMLQQYIKLISSQFIEQNLVTFEKMMPDYLKTLQQRLEENKKEQIATEAHKIKGAAGVVGLVRIQQLAQHIQAIEEPLWQEQVVDWVNLLAQQWKDDVQYLKTWLSNPI